MREALVFICSIVVISLSAYAEGPGYAILTTSNIVSQSTALSNFVAVKEAKGFTVSVVDNASVVSGGWGGGSGETAATNLHAWLLANYTNAQEQILDYVLFIGNPTNDVPMKICYPRSTNETCYTDFFYADLTSDWDANSNGFYGEYTEYTNGAIDRTYEVAVGRIPYYGDIDALDYILGKIGSYESSSHTNMHWRDKAMLAMRNQDTFTWGNEFGVYKVRNPILIPKEWDYAQLYYNTTPPCTEANVLSTWTNSVFGAVFWWAHGNTAGTEAVGVMSVSSVPSLPDDNPVFTFQCGCLQGRPATTNNLAYALLQNGAVSTVGASEITFYVNMFLNSVWHNPGVNPRIESDFIRRIVIEKMPAGDALYDLKEDNPPTTITSTPECWWMNYLSYNLYGCPAVGIHSCRFAGPQWQF